MHTATNTANTIPTATNDFIPSPVKQMEKDRLSQGDGNTLNLLSWSERELK